MKTYLLWKIQKGYVYMFREEWKEGENNDSDNYNDDEIDDNITIWLGIIKSYLKVMKIYKK